MRTVGSMIVVLGVLVPACVQEEDDPVGEDLAATTQALETFSQATLDNAFAQASNSANNFYGGKLTGPINGRQVAWKSTPWSASSSGEITTCTYGWCGFWPVGDCSKSSGDSNQGYSYGACNSTAWGERFAGILWNAQAKANFKTKVSGTTTFGYHPYWCFKYNGAVRTYHGWSYTNHCGTKVHFEVGTSTPAPAACGNGVVETGEACDLGATNGTFGTCCGTNCQFLPASSVCRQSTGDCDKAETCGGTSATCPSNGYESSGATTCTTDANCASLGSGYKCLALTSTTKKCWRTCRDGVGACDSIEYCGAERNSQGVWNAAAGPSCATDVVKAPGESCTYNSQSGTCSTMGVCDTAAIPAAWSCDESWWGDGRCDCGCGAYDADCNSAPTPVYQQCPGGQTCNKDQPVCVSSGTPSGWGSTGINCVAADLGDGYCDCGCGQVDPDCDKLGVRLYEHCASGSSCSWAEKTCHNNTSSSYIYENGESSFGACPKSWSTDSTCDIGCQFRDPKCGGPY